MSASVLDDPIAPQTVAAPDLSDLFDRYVREGELPTPDWFMRLQLERPRRSLHCLSPSTRFLKRLTDIVLSCTLLIFLAPLIAGEDYPPYRDGLPVYVELQGKAVRKRLKSTFVL